MVITFVEIDYFVYAGASSQSVVLRASRAIRAIGGFRSNLLKVILTGVITEQMPQRATSGERAVSSKLLLASNDSDHELA